MMRPSADSTPGEVRAQLSRDVADFCRAASEPYMPWDGLRVLVGGHEHDTRVDRLDVGLVEGDWQVVVFTRDGRVWQQNYLGGWLLSWQGPKARYEPLVSASGDNRIIGRRAECLAARRLRKREL